MDGIPPAPCCPWLPLSAPWEPAGPWEPGAPAEPWLPLCGIPPPEEPEEPELPEELLDEGLPLEDPLGLPRDWELQPAISRKWAQSSEMTRFLIKISRSSPVDPSINEQTSAYHLEP